jgi:hypothetical protein
MHSSLLVSSLQLSRGSTQPISPSLVSSMLLTTGGGGGVRRATLFLRAPGAWKEKGNPNTAALRGGWGWSDNLRLGTISPFALRLRKHTNNRNWAGLTQETDSTVISNEIPRREWVTGSQAVLVPVQGSTWAHRAATSCPGPCPGKHVSTPRGYELSWSLSREAREHTVRLRAGSLCVHLSHRRRCPGRCTSRVHRGRGSGASKYGCGLGASCTRGGSCSCWGTQSPRSQPFSHTGLHTFPDTSSAYPG